MAKKITFNPITGKFDFIDVTSTQDIIDAIGTVGNDQEVYFNQAGAISTNSDLRYDYTSNIFMPGHIYPQGTNGYLTLAETTPPGTTDTVTYHAYKFGPRFRLNQDLSAAFDLSGTFDGIEIKFPPAAGTMVSSGILFDSSEIAFNQFNNPVSSISPTINNNSIANSKLAVMPALRIKGNNTGSSASPIDLTVAQVKTMLAYTFLDLTDTPSSFSGQGGKFVAVNSGATALEFVSGSSAGTGLEPYTLFACGSLADRSEDFSHRINCGLISDRSNVHQTINCGLLADRTL